MNSRTPSSTGHSRASKDDDIERSGDAYISGHPGEGNGNREPTDESVARADVAFRDSFEQEGRRILDLLSATHSQAGTSNSVYSRSFDELLSEIWIEGVSEASWRAICHALTIEAEPIPFVLTHPNDDASTGSDDDLLTHARSLLAGGNQVAATAALEVLIRTGPTSAEAHALQGSVQMALGRTTEAERSLSVALILQSDAPDDWKVNLANCLKDRQKFQQALWIFASCLQRGVANLWTHHGIAECFSHIHEFPRASRNNAVLTHFRSAIEIDPDFPWAYLGLVNWIIEHGKLHEAVKPAVRFLELEPAHPKALSNAIRSLSRGGDVGEWLRVAALQFESLYPKDSLTRTITEQTFALMRAGSFDAVIALTSVVGACAPNSWESAPTRRLLLVWPEFALLRAIALLRTGRSEGFRSVRVRCHRASQVSLSNSERQAREHLYRDLVHPLFVSLFASLHGEVVASRQDGVVELDDIIQIAKLIHEHYADPQLAWSYCQLALLLPVPDASTGHDRRLDCALIAAAAGQNFQVVDLADRISSDAHNFPAVWAANVRSTVAGYRGVPEILFERIERFCEEARAAIEMDADSNRARTAWYHAVEACGQATLAVGRVLADAGNVEGALSMRSRGAKLTLAAASLLFPLPRHDRSSVKATHHRRVLIVGNRDIAQCFHYRVEQKLNHLRDWLAYDAEFVTHSELSGLNWQRHLLAVDLVIVARLPALAPVALVIAYANSLSIPVVYDVDDLIFDSQHFPPPLETYNGNIEIFQHRNLYIDNPLFLEAMASCDGVLASTVPLSLSIRALLPDVRIWIYPNLLDQTILDVVQSEVTDRKCDTQLGSLENIATKPVVIFYGSGTLAHKQVFHEHLLPVLTRILERFPGVVLRLIGAFELSTVPLTVIDRVECRSQLSYSEYLRELAQADINIAVLEHSEATDAKSELKWFEAGAFGIPSILTPTATYRAVVGDGEAVFADTQEDWERALTSLIESSSLRVAIGDRARVRALESYAPKVGVEVMRSLLGEVRRPKPNRKRLLIVNVFFAPQSIGGATRVVENQVKYLDSDTVKLSDPLILGVV